jgi:superfamily II DNA or RNA helicase
MNKNSFMFYPEITDDDFNEKIYLKKEFRDTEIKEKKNWNKGYVSKKDFILDPHQIFLKNYISPDTPYNGILIFHATGVGKTCTAISIAEGFKKTLKNMNKKILIISNLEKNFLKELYDPIQEKYKKNPEDIVQCTGKSYQLGEESLYLTQQQKEKELLKLKKSYYQFFGYGKFANYIIENTGGWKGNEKEINEKIKKFISKEFDDRVIIIDEIQNIKTDRKEELSRSIQPILECIIKYGKNIKLILMSATPMFDRPDEIIFYINLLLQNDGRKKIDRNDIFNSKDGTLKKDAEGKLREIFKGYVSYIRGEKPYVFPFRIYPKESTVPNIEYYMDGHKIEVNKKIKYTKLILCKMKDIQSNTYLLYFDKKIKNEKLKEDVIENNLEVEMYENDNINNMSNINNTSNININDDKNDKNDKKNIGLLDLIKISNITYPISNSNSKISDIGSFNKYSIDSDFDNGLGGYYRNIQTIGQRKKIQYRYQSHAIFNKDTVNEVPFADEKYIEKYSSKFAKILETIKRSKGLIFIFSQFIEQGTLPLALMLEQNGFYRECVEGEDQLLDYTPNKLKKGGKRRPICYLCGNEHNYIDHIDTKSKNYHIYKFAKYILYFGESKDIIKIKKDDALKKFRSDKNKYGEEIKVFIGTRSVSEGLDFKRLRQVHILEPWYNLSRHEQIIGRAIRYLSHRDLLPEEKNVEIYQYAAILNDDKNLKRETVDLKNYRIAENKDIIIKNIGRIMKESAVDCVFFRNTNIIESDKKEKQITSSGEVIYVPIIDKPFSSLCDYKEECNYKCNWTPNPKIKYPINTDTYNLHFASSDIEVIKKFIKNMYRENIVYHLKLIEENVLKNFENVDKIFIYSALEELVNNKNEIIYDKFGRKGYIIYRGDYYVFQPFDLERDDIPLIYRMYPSDVKPDFIDLENISVDYEEKIKNKKNDIIDEDKLIKITLKNIESLYDEHIEISKLDGGNIKKYLLSIIGLVLDNLNTINLKIFVTYILNNYLQNNKIEYIKDIIDYLNLNNKLINYYSDIKYDKTKIKNNFYVGFIINKQYYILDIIDKDKDVKNINYNNLKYILCSKELLNKIKSYRDLIKKTVNDKYNKIYAIIEYDPKQDIKKFKIVDKSIEEEILTKEKQKSKRSIITGRICSTFQVNKILEIRKKIGMYDIVGKKVINFICKDLEIYFRYKNLMDNNLIWLEESETK